jgi:hypothetical protein
VLALGASSLLARAVQLGDGMWAEGAWPFLLAAFACLQLAVGWPAGAMVPAAESALGNVLPPLGTACLAWHFAQWTAERAPAKFLRFAHNDQALQFTFYAAFLAVFAGRLVAARPPDRHTFLLAFVGLFALAGAWLLIFSPDPDIDVVMVHRHSLDAFWSGHNPYAITFPAPPLHQEVFGPGMVEGGRLQFGYPYPPLNLLLALPAHLLGDYRGALLAAMLATAVLMGSLQRQAVAALPSVLLLSSPRILYDLEMGWTEPVSLMCLALLVWSHARWRRGVGACLGLWLASKQYVILFVPLAALLPALSPLTVAGRRQWAIAIGVAALVTGPFVLWSPFAFWRDLVTTQLGLPFRPDALNFSGWLWHRQHVQLPSACGFAAGVLAAALCAWRMPRTRAGFALSFAYVFLCFIAFNRQAFANYYYYIQGALLLGVAATPCASLADEPPGSAAATAASPG